MTWIQRLYEAYDNCLTVSKGRGVPLLPISHSIQQVHVEITLNENGELLNAEVLEHREDTVIPVTEDSAARSSGCAPHGLADKIQYCAKDYPAYGGKKPSYFESYIKQLENWCNSSFAHKKALAVYKYLQKGTLAQDLIKKGVLWIEANKEFLTKAEDLEKQEIFKILAASGEKDQGDVFVRWKVEIPGDLQSKTWEDVSLTDSWVNFQNSNKDKIGMCYITGKKTALTEKHPSKIRHGGDKAKLISFNDKDGFTYRGKFEDANQACKVSYEVSQKAHSVLKWLLDSRRKQAYFNGDQVIVAWSVQNGPLPNPFLSSYQLFKEYDELEQGFEIDDNDFQNQYTGDLGFDFSKNLALRMKGINSPVREGDDIVVMGVDSATTGRLSVIYYREFKGGELIERVEKWHQKYAWHNNFNGFNFIGAPSPEDIVKASYGEKCDDKFKKASIEKILPCILEGETLPGEFALNAFRRACNPVAMDYWVWEKTLRAACALLKGSDLYKEGYKMGLDKTSKDRSYLYGRLVAIADYAERNALKALNEDRGTNAERFMHAVSVQPFKNWERLHNAFKVYMPRLKSRYPGAVRKAEEMLNEVNGMFDKADYENNGHLDGNFLLGFYHQRQDLWTKKDAEDNDEDSTGAGSEKE